MRNMIPGTVPEAGREFFYIEIRRGEGFNEVVDAALKDCIDVPLPKDGGVIEEKAQLRLKDGPTLLAISYRGDLPGWRLKLAAYCVSEKRLWGTIKGHDLVLSDGSVLKLGECDIVFEP